MSLSWHERKSRLSYLLNSKGDEGGDGLALDRILHGQTVIGKTSKTIEIDELRFKDGDLSVIGTLESGQFGVIDVVKCSLDGRVYVRKSTEKHFALRYSDQCSPQLERNILSKASETHAKWAPHLLCAFQTATHVSLVMDYAEGGTLWDVLESSPHDGKILEDDLRWWCPQIVSAIHWCHSQGFVHRDIKPHNFVLTSTSHVLLIDFGSAAPLLPPEPDGTQRVPKHYCSVPCGTCDYISPEILRAHEDALLALEMSADGQSLNSEKSEGYGRETDWWSLGSMLYEMRFGVAPFFASDIQQTYLKIINHKSSLQFNRAIKLSSEYRDLLRRLLTNHEQRLGRKSIAEVTGHPFFLGVDWSSIQNQSAPPSLHIPQFIYASPNHQESQTAVEQASVTSEPFPFSVLFQSTKDTSISPDNSFVRSTPNRSVRRPQPSSDSTAAFIGFSWGPLMEAFEEKASPNTPNSAPFQVPIAQETANLGPTAPPDGLRSTPQRPSALPTHPLTGTIRRTAPRRNVTDREAMKQLADCVGMSARKKVLESGRKPKRLPSHSRSGSWRIKELDFETLKREFENNDGVFRNADGETIILSSDTESEGPPSPSPGPRPGSAMSVLSIKTLSRVASNPSLRPPGTGKNLNAVAKRPTLKESPTLPQSESAPSAPTNSRKEEADHLEEKYKALMEDIEEVEQKLATLAVQIKGEG